MSNYYIQEVERVSDKVMGNDKVTIQSFGSLGCLRSFKNMKELNKFALTLGFEYQFNVSNNTYLNGEVKSYLMSHNISDVPNRYFWDLSELPLGSKKVTLTENGSDVTCYFINDGQTIHIFRPNCNAKNVYKLY